MSSTAVKHLRDIAVRQKLCQYCRSQIYGVISVLLARYSSGVFVKWLPNTCDDKLFEFLLRIFFILAAL